MIPVITIKRFYALFLICVLFILPFAAAENVTSLLNTYDNAKKHFDKAKEELVDCQATGDECEDIEEDVLDAAIDTAEEGIALMLAYLEYSGIDGASVTDLEKALDDLDYVQDKDDFEKVVASAKTVWASVSVSIKQKTIEDLYAAVEELVDKGELIDAKLSCGVEELDASDVTLTSAVASFSAAIATADQRIDAAEDLLSKGDDLDSVLATIKDAQASLKESQRSLSTAHTALTAAGGSLCSEVTIVEDDDDDDDDENGDDTDEEDEAEQEAEQEDTEEAEAAEDDEEETEEQEQDLDELLDDYGLSDYYDDAEDAIENLEEYISEKEDDGYDATDAEEVLEQAKEYLAQGEDLVLESSGNGALSRFFNAKQTAERGMNSEYYDYNPGSSSASGSADYVAFVDCMEGASYSYQRTICYDDYGIADGTQSDINECLSAASSESDRITCYSEADEEAEEQEGDDEEALQDRIDAVQDSLEALEEEVTDLYDALAATDEDSSSDDYEALDSDIDDLLDTVQGDIQGYEDDLDDAQDEIDLGDEDEADELLDALEDEVEEYIEDIEEQIAEIQEDIDAL